MEREGPATSETRIESLTIVSMLRIGGRDFPKPIFVSDQKYVYEAPAAEREALPALPLFPYADLDRKKNIESRK